MKERLLLGWMLGAGLLASAAGCSVLPSETTTAAAPSFYNGTLIPIAGTAGSGASDISFLSRATSRLTSDAYNTVNTVRTGEGGRFGAIYNGRVYVAVENSNRLKTANAQNLQNQGDITLTLPHSMAVFSDTLGLVAQGSATLDTNGRLFELNPNLNTVGATPKNLDLLADQFVALRDTVYLLPDIRANNRRVGRYVLRGRVLLPSWKLANTPTGAAADAYGQLWVLCSNTARLVRLNTTDGSVLQTVTLPDAAATTGEMVPNASRTQLYFLAGRVLYRFTPGSSPVALITLAGRQPLHLGYDPTSNLVFVSVVTVNTDPETATARLLRINPQSGAIQDSFSLGVRPGRFLFN